MDLSYESLEGVAHVRTSDGFVQVMKLASSDEEESDDGFDDDGFDEYDDDEENLLIENSPPTTLRPLPEPPLEESEDVSLENLHELYAKVDKTQTKLGKRKKKEKELEMEAVMFRVKVSTYLESEESRAKLFKSLRVYHESKDVKKLVKNLKRILNTDKSHPLFKEIKLLLSPEHVAIYEKLTEPNKNGERLIKVSRKRGEESFGFSFRGGREFGLGIFITAVANNSPAHNAGLKPGDEVRKINGLPLVETLHEEFLAILRLDTSVTLLVKNVGRIPCKSEEDIIWNKINEDETNGRIIGTEQQDLSKTDRLISFTVGKEGIGCVIQKGVENHNGIFIVKISEHSLAEEVNLMVGDQILDVNGKSFRNIAHKQAVDCLKGKNRLTMIVRYNEEVYQLLTGPKEIKPILVTEPKPIEDRIDKKAKFSSSKTYEIIEYEEEEEEFNEDENEIAVIPSASNFDYPQEVLQGREVHYVVVPKVASLDIDLLRRNRYISVIAVHGGGAIQRHGFIQPGDWILNVEGDDLIDVQLKKAKEIINNAMRRWSAYIEFIIACPPGRKPVHLPTKEETGKVLKDPQFTLKATVNNQSFMEKFDGVKDAVNIFEGKPIYKRKLKSPTRIQLDDSVNTPHSGNYIANSSFTKNDKNLPTSRPSHPPTLLAPQGNINKDENVDSSQKEKNENVITDSTPYSNVRAVKVNVEKAKKPAPPPPTKQKSPPSPLLKGGRNASSNLKDTDDEEENFSIKEMIQLHNSATRDTILKAREKTVSDKAQMFKQSNENLSSDTTINKPVPGKISTSFFETKTNQSRSSLPPHMIIPKKRSDSNASFSNLSTVNSRSGSFTSDAGSESKLQTNKQKIPTRLNHSDVLKDLDESLDATLDSGRSNSSLASSSSSLNFTLDLSASMIGIDSTDTVYNSPVVSDQNREVANDDLKRSSLPPTNTVSNVRSIFQNENKKAAFKNQESPPKSQEFKSQNSYHEVQQSPFQGEASFNGNESSKKFLVNTEEIPKAITVSSARNIFQQKPKNDSMRYSNRQKDEPAVMRTPEKSSKPSRLTSPNLFFEPQREEQKEEKSLLISEEIVESLDSARTPKDIWEASQEEFNKIDKTEESDLKDDATVRTRSLLMRQSSMGETPAEVQMAQILGDKNEETSSSRELPSSSPKIEHTSRAELVSTSVENRKVFQNNEATYDVHLKKATQNIEDTKRKPEENFMNVQLKTPKSTFNARENHKSFNVQLKKETVKNNEPHEEITATPFQDFEFKRTVSEPIKRAPEATPNEMQEFKFKRTVSNLPKKPESVIKTPIEITLDNNLKPSKMNMSRGSYKQPPQNKKQSDQIRNFIEGIDFSSNEPASPIPLTNPSQPGANEYKPVNISELRTQFQSNTKEENILVLEKNKTNNSNQTETIKRNSNTPLGPQPPNTSPSAREIKSILSKSKRANSKKVQFSNFVDVGVAASLATSTEKHNGHEDSAAPPQPPPPPPPANITNKAENTTADIGGIVDQINQSSDMFTKNFASDPGTQAKTNTTVSPRTSREALMQAKKRFANSSKELTSKLNLGKDEELSYGSARPKGLSWFSDRSGHDRENSKKQNGFDSIPAY